MGNCRWFIDTQLSATFIRSLPRKTYSLIVRELNRLKNPQKIKAYEWFFKTGPGEYGAGDVFLGLNSKQVQDIAQKYFKAADFSDLQQLLNSKIHEQRMCALRILVYQFEQAKDAAQKQKKIFDFYLKNYRRINNWDLVDVSAPWIVGQYLWERATQKTQKAQKAQKTPAASAGGQEMQILFKLARSKNLWQRRIAIISTSAFIRAGQFTPTLKIAKILLPDKHDLIHKAVGWMLREVGKKDEAALLKFLDKFTLQMPRTCLRYAIERLEEKKRKYYLNLTK